MKTRLFSLLALSLALTGSASAETKVRIATRVLNDDLKIILLAVKAPDSARTEATSFNASDLGFKGDDLTETVPRFLITVSRAGPEQIYSFSLGDFDKNQKPIVTRATPDRVAREAKERIEHPERFAALPPRLLDMKTVRGRLVRTAIAKAILNIGRFTPVGPVAMLIDHAWKHSHDIRASEARYLDGIVTQALADKTHPLARALSASPERQSVLLKSLGAALSMIYHPDRKWWAALPLKKSERTEFYEDLRGRAMARATTDMGKLVKEANQNGEYVIPIGEEVALVFYDRNDPTAKDRFVPNFENKLSPEELEAQRALLPPDAASGGRQLVFKGLYVNTSKRGPLQMIDANDPDKVARRDRSQRLRDLGKDLLYSTAKMAILPYAALKLTDAGIHFILRKSLTSPTIFEYRLNHVGEALALLETQQVHLDTNEIVYSEFLKNLEELGASPEFIAATRAALTSGDKARQDEAAASAMSLILNVEQSKMISSGSKNLNLRHEETRAIHTARLQKYLSDEKRVEKLRKTLEDRSVEAENAGRSPGSVADAPSAAAPSLPAAVPAANPARPVIVLLVDGLRPDRFRQAAEAGMIPNLKRRFLDRGVELQSYTSRSLTLPSWSTVLTGFEPDEHGVRSNSPATRADGGSIQNFCDIRKELFYPKYVKKGRGYRVLEDSGTQWLPRYFAPNEVVLNYMPINEDKYPPVGRLLLKTASEFRKMVAGMLNPPVEFDQVSIESAISKIKRNPGQTKLVVLWLSAVDALSHANNSLLGEAMKALDTGVESLLRTAESDSVLKDAKVFIIADHGHRGGHEESNPARVTNPEAHEMYNTGFNLSRFFTGDFPESRDYRFVVRSASSPEPDYDLRYLHEFFIQPFQYISHGERAYTRGAATVVIDESGDNLAQVVFAGNGSGTRLNYAQLSQYSDANNTTALNIPSDLLKLQLRNLVVADPKVRQALRESAALRPVEYFAMPLAGAEAWSSLKRQLAPLGLGDFTRDPILVQAYGRQSGLILTRDRTDEVRFAYVPVQQFQQTPNGTVTAGIGTAENEDPLQYLGKVGTLNELTQWKTDREWLAAAVAKNHAEPTVVFSLARTLTLSPRLTGIPQRTAEVPEFVLIANRGFAFHGGGLHQSDHGGYSTDEVRQSFFVSGLGISAPSAAGTVHGPVLGRDATPTILDYAGMRAAGSSGKSWKAEIENHSGK